MNELWDAYDNAFNKISDVTLVRGEPLSERMYHLVAEVIVRHIDGTYLLMQRDFAKTFGGMWELSAGGSALQGESSLDCAIRELMEETGIIATEMKEIGRVVHDGYHTLFVEYLCITDCEKDSIKLQEGETVNFRWIDKSSLLEMSGEEFVSERAMKLMKKLDI